jgi:DNA mismatch endonuclease (patch repair protein)
MARIKAKDTRPERHLRCALHRAGFRFRLHGKDLAGHPDLVLAKYRAAIFVHGCFWHRHLGCAYAYDPKTRPAFWRQKFDENVERDKRQVSILRKSGWRVAIVWECGLRSAGARSKTNPDVIEWLRSNRGSTEIPANPELPRPRSVQGSSRQ